ncbi:PTS glucose transporter subunit IIA [Mycoplasmopsis equigenitalium]|uniref:PTS glucose transporter subunit IIA n=1 Tax=Mycoplasmopsis equigenitalium TaxID=114883 RepID=A0ABY5J3I9_9BACT|nr:PTS glucose transporter subunit IIA [Mycoplasmopsis equigenitalium]UUD36712.1 PTS glucose transporter subunit IIA [Mycoplasmopsis equigenitalium]
MKTNELIKLAQALGGFDNIVLMSNCATKLRYDIANKNCVDVELLKELNPYKVKFVGDNHIQIDFREDAEQINLSLQNLRIEGNVKIEINNKNQEIPLKNEEVTRHKYECDNIIYATNKGETIPLQKLKDDAFSKFMLGHGFAIKVDDLKTVNIYSPVDGKITFVYPTKHAYGIKTKFGNELLVHIGIGLGKYNGVGLESFVKVGQEVKHGDKIAFMDVNKLKKFKDETLRYDVITVLTDPVRRYTEFELIEKNIAKPNIPWFRI